MVLGCKICSLPLLCDPSENLNPLHALISMRRQKRRSTAFDLDDTLVITTKCGHMFHRGCLKEKFLVNVERGSSGTANRSPCPHCNRPVVLSQIQQVKIEASPKEFEQIKRNQSLKLQNAELEKNLAAIRNRTKEQEKRLEGLREKIKKFNKAIDTGEKSLTKVPSFSEVKELKVLGGDIAIHLRALYNQNSKLVHLIKKEILLSKRPNQEYPEDQPIGENNGDGDCEQVIHSRPLDLISKLSSTVTAPTEGLLKMLEGLESENVAKNTIKAHERFPPPPCPDAQYSFSNTNELLNLLNLETQMIKRKVDNTRPPHGGDFLKDLFSHSDRQHHHYKTSDHSMVPNRSNYCPLTTIHPDKSVKLTASRQVWSNAIQQSQQLPQGQGSSNPSHAFDNFQRYQKCPALKDKRTFPDNLELVIGAPPGQSKHGRKHYGKTFCKSRRHHHSGC